jgi:lactam utilization protein B
VRWRLAAAWVECMRCAQVFADRRYMADGTLAPRALEGAVIHEPAEAIEHALQLAAGHPVNASVRQTVR